MERHGGTLEGKPDRDEHHADDQPGRRLAAAAEQTGDVGEAGGSGEAVDQRGSVEQHPRGQRPEHKILEPGFGRAHRIPVEARHDIQGQALQFEAEIERDQIVSRDHDHHPGGREQYQHREFKSGYAVLLVVAEPHDDRDGRAEQHQRLHEDGKGVADEHAVKADLPLAAENAGNDQRRDQYRDR